MKILFDTGKKTEPKKMSALNELFIDGFDEEQIWQMIQLQNEPLIKYLDKQVDSLLKLPEKEMKIVPDEV